MFDFTGKVALITGSSSGIGAAIAEKFAEYGADVTITGRDQEALEKVSNKIFEKTKREPLKIIGDLFDDSIPSKLIQETLDKFGRLDILVNNAATDSPFDSIDDENLMEEYDKMFKLNVRVPLNLIYLAKDHLQKTKGNVINISSIASFEPIFFVYSMSKAALDMLTKGAAQELGPKGVRVNSINPGPTITGMGRALGEDRDYLERCKDEFSKLTVLDRMPYPNEQADLAMFLASDYAKNITGSIIVNDGGMLVKKKHDFTGGNKHKE